VIKGINNPSGKTQIRKFTGLSIANKIEWDLKSQRVKQGKKSY
jgi:hypothetical protein